MLRSTSGIAKRFGARALSTQTGKDVDVVIAGAGIMGLNIAYHLKSRDPGMKVLVLDKAPALGHGSSGWSTGFMRAFYSFDDTMRLALDGIRAYKNWGDYLKIKEPKAYFTETGALWMLGKTKCGNEEMAARLKQFGVESDVLDAQGVKAKFPAFNTDPYPEYNLETGEPTGREFGELSALYEHGCGHLDSSSCLEDILEACQREGVDVKFNTAVAAVTQAGGKATGVKLGDGSEISAGVVVNCLGPWFKGLNDTVGVETTTTMLPTRIQVGHVSIETEDLLSLPFTADGHGASGIYFMPRRANKQLVFGSVDHRFESEVVENPDECDPLLDSWVEADYLGCLLHRLPTLPTKGKVIGFSHMYTVNQDDVHPVIGPSSLSGYFLCNGFSGHGFKLAPGVGSMVAQQITGTKATAGTHISGWETSAPIDFLAANRKPLSMEVKTHFA
jgi:glycine/D-amino acid oxidase-like deaminating enzyme